MLSRLKEKAADLCSGKSILSATVASTLVASNVAASKIASISAPLVGAVTMPAGFVGIAIAFLATDLLSELYGRAEARSAVNGAIGALAVSWAVIYSAIALPAAPFYGMEEAFNGVMGQSAHIVAASIMTLMVSQNVDVSVFHKIKDAIPTRAARNVGSTAVSQAVDTAMFIGLGFVVLPSLFGGSPLPLGQAAALIAGQYAVKLGIVAADTPLFYAITEVTNRD